MRSFTFAGLMAVTAMLSTSVIAHETTLNKRHVLVPRQGQAVEATSVTGEGDTCEEAFGPGSIECAPATATESRWCYNPGEGDSCCANKYACGSNLYCLVDNKCCPQGLDPVTCATNNGVTLPSGWTPSTSSTGSEGLTMPKGNSSYPVYPTATGTGTFPPYPTFTGAASSQRVNGGVAVVVVGVAGLMAYAL